MSDEVWMYVAACFMVAAIAFAVAVDDLTRGDGTSPGCRNHGGVARVTHDKEWGIFTYVCEDGSLVERS